MVHLTEFHVGKHKSFADDLNMERGTVSMRVALRYDLLRFSPCSFDLYLKSIKLNKSVLTASAVELVCSPPSASPNSKQTTVNAPYNNYKNKQLASLPLVRFFVLVLTGLTGISLCAVFVVFFVSVEKLTGNSSTSRCVWPFFVFLPLESLTGIAIVAALIFFVSLYRTYGDFDVWGLGIFAKCRKLRGILCAGTVCFCMTCSLVCDALCTMARCYVV